MSGARAEAGRPGWGGRYGAVVSTHAYAYFVMRQVSSRLYKPDGSVEVTPARLRRPELTIAGIEQDEADSLGYRYG
jgi:hypothetical protein